MVNSYGFEVTDFSKYERLDYFMNKYNIHIFRKIWMLYFFLKLWETFLRKFY
uniref:hypothetical protein n=1 Tax=Clostridium estertheticum TaxID=238834 RepID=UPI00209B6FEE|nr:hypothetical protein [Clostridium estertheticum]